MTSLTARQLLDAISHALAETARRVRGKAAAATTIGAAKPSAAQPPDRRVTKPPRRRRGT